MPKLLKWLTILAICVVAPGYFLTRSYWAEEEGVTESPDSLLIHRVRRDDFEAFVTESGDIESSGSVEIKCEVKSEGRAATTILDIVDEGSVVKKGDFLVKFDDSALQQSLTQQDIVVATDERTVIDAESELKKAKQTLAEYRDGLFLVDKETFESELLQAESQLKTSEDMLAHAERMFKRGYVSQLQLEAQEVAVQMAKKNVQVVKTKLMVHNEFTLQKMVGEYEADIKKQEAALRAANSTLKLSQQRRQEIADQIEKCTVKAPSAGQVVFANDFERRENIVIEEGAQVREGQVVIRLPSPEQMQVKARINDSKIKQVKVGNSVAIELDVNPNLAVRGVVSKINPFPYPRQWYGGPIEYGTEIRIENAPPDLTPGQRAKVRIFVERQEDVVQVPIQSVVERSGEHFCVVRDDKGAWSTRTVTIGSDNGSFVVLNEGVKEGEEVALNPDLLWDDLVTDEQVSEAEPARRVAARDAE